MTNFRKSFNFKNGVQVDNDKFVVNPNGLVGIGTSIPSEILNVVGTVKISGILTTNYFMVGSASTFYGDVGIGTQVRVSTAGSITADKYYGDGGFLLNLPTSQWVDVNAGFGYTSIYAAGNVGIATTSPFYTFQIGGGPTSTTGGIGFNSNGNIYSSGIITASSFVGSGINVTSINADNIASGTLSNDRIPTLLNAKLPTFISVSGINVSGVITSSVFQGTLVGIASTARSLIGSPNIEVGILTASSVNTGYSTIGIATITDTFHVGTDGTVFSSLVNGRIGIGTAIPTSDLQLRRPGSALLEVISNTSESKISIGQSVGVGNSSAVVRFGNSVGVLDVLNYSTGNINNILHAGGAGINTGNFAWIYGQNSLELMTLTYDGKLGINNVSPKNTLHVVGTSTVTGNAWFGGNLVVSGSINAGSFALPNVYTGNVNATSGVSTFNNIESIGKLVLTSAASSIGIGTNSPIVGLDARNYSALFQKIGIGTNNISGDNTCLIGGSISILSEGYIGIGTTSPIDLTPNPEFGQIQFYTRTIDLNNSLINVKNDGAIGFNTYESRSIFDYGRVGSATTNPYMILPNVTTAVRAGLAQTVEGAIIYNSTTKKHQGYGSTDGGTTFGWNDLY